jgi:hypothetical protein
MSITYYKGMYSKICQTLVSQGVKCQPDDVGRVHKGLIQMETAKTTAIRKGIELYLADINRSQTTPTNEPS